MPISKAVITLSEQTVQAYRRRMVNEGIPTQDQAAYLLWVRFYLDFCQKYSYAPREGASLLPFLEKLKTKKQSEVAQAGRAVRLILKRAVSRPTEEQGKKSSPNSHEGEDCELPQNQGNRQGASWAQEYKGLEGAIKLRNYSGRTYDAYRMWLQKFQAFTQSKPPEAFC